VLEEPDAKTQNKKERKDKTRQVYYIKCALQPLYTYVVEIPTETCLYPNGK
jgi:hypothetical protein